MALQNFVDRALPAISAAWLNAVDRLKEYLGDSSATDRGDALVAVKRTTTGAVATDLHAWMEAQRLSTQADFGLSPDGTTDHTSAIVARLTALGGAGFRGWVQIPYNTRFTLTTVYAAVPTGVMLDDESSINWAQPPSYKNKFRVMYSGDTAADDSQAVYASPHHPSILLLNMGTSGSTSGNSRLASILAGNGIDYAKDPMLGWVMQFGKDPAQDEWAFSLRAQTPYAVAMANPQLHTPGTNYSAGAYCIGASGAVYQTSAGGVAGATTPTGTGSVSDGTVTWSYIQSGLSIDSTRFLLDFFGTMNLYGPTARINVTGLGANKSASLNLVPTDGASAAAPVPTLRATAGSGLQIVTSSGSTTVGAFLDTGLQIDVLGTQAAAVSIPSASTITPTKRQTFVSGTAAIDNIAIPAAMSNGGYLILIPTGAWTTTTGGNIANAITATANVPVLAVWDGGTGKYYMRA